jgi:hypothetical protein
MTSVTGRLTAAAGGATGVGLATGAGTVTALSAALSMLVGAGATGGLMVGAGAGGTTGATLLVSLTSLAVAAGFA